jgi:hypothetical protein
VLLLGTAEREAETSPPLPCLRLFDLLTVWWVSGAVAGLTGVTSAAAADAGAEQAPEAEADGEQVRARGPKSGALAQPHH